MMRRGNFCAPACTGSAAPTGAALCLLILLGAGFPTAAPLGTPDPVPAPLAHRPALLDDGCAAVCAARPSARCARSDAPLSSACAATAAPASGGADPLGNVTETTDTQERKVRIIYDRHFRVVRREVLPGTGGESVVTNDSEVATDAAAAANQAVPVVEIAYDQSGLTNGRWRMQTSVAGVVQSTAIVDALGRTHETHTPIVLQPANAPGVVSQSVVKHLYHPVSGFLTSITDPRNEAWVTTITSDLAGRQIGTQSPSGITTTTTLNTVGWTLAQTLADHDQTTRMAYDGCGRLLRTVNPAGGVTVAQYDTAGNLLGTDSGAGRGPRMAINDAGEVTAVTDAFGATTRQAWDDHEPILRTTSQRGPGQILEHTQTLDDRALATQFASRIPSGSSEDAVQVTLSLRNDGTPSVAPSTLGAEQRFRVDGFGRSLQSAPQQWMNGQLVEIPQTVTQRDALGQVVGTAQGLGRRDQAVTDATGAVIAQKDNAQATDGAPTETSVAWEVVERDLAGRTLVHRQLTGDPQKPYLVQTMTYDEEGRLKTQTMPGRGTRRIDYSGVRVTAEYLNNELRVAHSDFDAFNQPQATWTAGEPAQTVTRDTDAYGRVWRQRVGDEETVTFFDARTGVSTGTRTSTGLVRLGRDKAGRVTTTTDAEGRTVHTEYDARDRVIARTHPDGRREAMTYVKDTSLVKTHFNGVDTTQVHDYAPDGFRKETTTQRGSEPAVVTTFARSIATTSGGVANGVISTVTQDGQTQIMTSDRVGRMVSLQYPGQDPIATTYDRAGRQVTHGDKSYTYNAEGLVETITQAGTGATVIFGYTAEGWVSSVTLPHGVTRTYGHDLAGRITGMTQLVGDTAEPWSVTRDTQGRVVSMTGPDSSRSFTYRQQRLVRERRTGDGAALTLYRYDASGNRIAQSTFAEPVAKNLAITAGTIPMAVTVITGTWNAPANGELAVTTNTGTAMADVAQVGTGEEAVAEHTLMVAVGGTNTGTVAAGAAFEGTSFRYHLLWQRRPLSGGFGEQEGRLLIQRVDRGTEITTDVVSSEWSADTIDTRTLRLTWWPDGSLEVATGPASSETAISWRVGTTELPSLPSNASIALVALAADGATSASATFSAVQWSVTTANRAAWTAIYNAANELVSRTETGAAGMATESYAYSPAGELTDLQRTGYNPQTIQYGYDAFNRRISQTVQNTQGTATYGYAYHLNTWRRQSLTHSNGDVTAFAWDGQDLIRETTTLAGGGSTAHGYFNHNRQPLWQHGTTPSSVTVYGRDLLGDITGHIVPASLPDEPLPGMAVYARKFRHDAFGVRSETLRQVEFGGVISYVTPTVASFGPSYKGQYQDPAGDIYMRHRYYLPQLGAFGSVDPAKAGGNWHAYAGGDPVNYFDPSGLWHIRNDTGTAEAEPGDTIFSLWQQLGGNASGMGWDQFQGAVGYFNPGRNQGTVGVGDTWRFGFDRNSAFIAFDGTANHVLLPSDAGGTNPAIMAELSQALLVQYLGGVGNAHEYGRLDQTRGMVEGWGAGAIVDRAIARVREAYGRGIRRVDAVGFSRGAAQNVEFAFRLQGLIESGELADLQLGFFGYFDAVPAFHRNLWDGNAPGSGMTHLPRTPSGSFFSSDTSLAEYQAYKVRLPKMISSLHLVALDENRVDFSPLNIEGAWQYGLLGAHSDVGGGYVNKGLSNFALHLMVDYARRSGAPLRTVAQAAAQSPEAAARFGQYLPVDTAMLPHRQLRAFDVPAWGYAASPIGGYAAQQAAYYEQAPRYLPPMHAIFPGWISPMTYDGSRWVFANPNFTKD